MELNKGELGLYTASANRARGAGPRSAFGCVMGVDFCDFAFYLASFSHRLLIKSPLKITEEMEYCWSQLPSSKLVHHCFNSHGIPNNPHLPSDSSVYREATPRTAGGLIWCHASQLCCHLPACLVQPNDGEHQVTLTAFLS